MKKFLNEKKFGSIRNRQENGITLIAMIITIVIILIIAGIAISFIGNDNGILNKSLTARKENLKSEAEEQLKVKLSEYLVDNQGISDLNQLDGIVIDGYEVNSTKTGRVISMIKGEDTFSYLVDENFNVTPLGSAVTGSSGSITQLEFQPEINLNSSGVATIKVPDSIVNQYNPVGYIYVIDGKVKNCSMNSTYNCNLLSNQIEVILMDISEKMSISKSITTNITIANYAYKGSTEIATLKAGKYMLEVWGAQGGGSYGGKGAYAKGEIEITVDTNIYINAGGQGNGNLTRTIGAGGFNGGGNAGYGVGYGTGYGGGGASDIRINENNFTSRIIVAGGGGGGQTGGTLSGGFAGGSGTAGTGGLWCCGNAGVGATTIGPGAGGIARVNATGSGVSGLLGIGGDGHNAPTYQGGAGGGGGYYGGGGASDGCGGAAGGGGSSYVGNLKSTQLKAGNETMISPTGSSEIGHSGNGNVRITKIN